MNEELINKLFDENDDIQLLILQQLNRIAEILEKIEKNGIGVRK